ncbi:DUF3348 family protein [Herbaspirillum sp. GCM10030257]|uniref:DUF3348 family protein n=1 Tax=Herbaspirillum sp. GCM10030257 TaxID=3273393 RepID=UPI003614CB5F
MTRVLPRTNFHSSELIRCLTDLAIADPAEPENAFAEKLGLWIHFTDAITLSAVHGDGIASSPGRRLQSRSVTRIDLNTEFDRVREFLVNSIRKSCLPASGKTHIALPTPKLELPIDLVAAYVPYRRFYEAHQRDMELSIQPLRVNAREALAQASSALKKLAELDAALEKILRDREAKLLPKLPVLLKKRFEHLFKAHQQMLVDTQQADDPANWTQAGGWLARFCNDMQRLLLAELDLRLQPTLGLIEAFNSKICNE